MAADGSIVHITTSLAVGGAERSLLRLVSGTSQDRPFVVSAQGGLLEGKYVEALDGRLVVCQGGKLVGAAAAVWQARTQMMVRHQPVAHGWMYHGALASILAVVGIPKAKVVWGIRHALGRRGAISTSARAALRLCGALSARPDAIVFNSRASMEAHSRLNWTMERASVIENGVDAEQFRPDAERRQAWRQANGIDVDTILVVAIGRHHPTKGFHILYEAFGELLRSTRDLKCVIVGRGHALDAHTPLPGERVLMLEEAGTAVPEVLAAADILVVPSLTESLPNVLLEGMASSVPVVATDVGDVKRVLGGAGIVVPPGSVPALVEALMTAVSWDRASRQARGAQGRDVILGGFTVTQEVDKYRDLYHRLRTDVARRSKNPAG